MYYRREVTEEVGPLLMGCSDGVIDKIATKEEALASGEVVKDYGSLVVCPGIVDSHVHVNEPGRGLDLGD